MKRFFFRMRRIWPFARRLNAPAPAVIELKLRDIKQLFNSFDPSPFYEKDLDDDAENYIVSWAREMPQPPGFRLVIHLDVPPVGVEAAPVEQAIRRFFRYRAEMSRLAFLQLMRQGRASLMIGLLFMAVCLGTAQLLARMAPSNLFLEILRESLAVGSWVSLWRPLEIYLYGWWPLRNTWRLYRKMSRMGVEFRVSGRDLILPQPVQTERPPV
jgi:hypothetical protein